VGNQVPLINPFAVKLVCLVVLGLIAAAVVLDLYLELFTNGKPLGARITTWARRYPGFMSGVALLFGAMVGHFFFSLPSP
jgi:hypothetical protein